MRKVIYPDGTEKLFDGPISMAQIEAELGCDCVDSFRLRDEEDHVVIVDDVGHEKELPKNPVATELYRKTCNHKSGRFFISGPVYVCPDSDFEV